MAETKPLVMAVDDEQEERNFLKRVLEPAGYRVITASDGSQALALASEMNLGAVILDVRMPGKSGMEVLEEMREDHPDIAVIMVTGVSDVDIAIDAMRKGALDYLTKPYNVNELVMSVARALETRRLIMENRDYRLNLERKVAEQTQLLQQKVRELTALNNLFVTYLNQGFEAAGTYSRLASGIIKEAKEVQDHLNQGSDANEAIGRLVSGIITAAEEIQTLAKESEARKVEVQASPVDK